MTCTIPSVKETRSTPFKGLYDSSKLELQGKSSSPDFIGYLAYPVTESKPKLHEDSVVPDVESSWKDAKDIAKRRRYAGGAGSNLVVATKDGAKILFGGGKLKDGKMTGRESTRKLAINVAEFITTQKPVSVELNMPEMCDEAFPYFVAYLRFAMYVEDRFRANRSKTKPIETILSFPAQSAKFDQLLVEANKIAESIIFLRELADAPPNYSHPQAVKDAAKCLAQEGGMEFKSYDWQQCHEMKMGGFCAVSQGMTNEPAFIHMTYKNGNPTRRIALVGKGVCMDTGGYALKPAASMFDMHHDMCGAAVALGTAKLIGAIQPKDLHIDFIIPCVENLVDAQAYLNGDVLTTMSGITVLVKNTDAEGRLILCDGITYALKMFEDQKVTIPRTIITTATLTGSCIHALGKKMAAFYCTDESHAKVVESAAEKNVDKVWRMPLDSRYEILNEDDRGDLPNVSKLGAGSVTAAKFLQAFVTDETVDFMHFDIAGVMTNAKSQCDGYGPIMFTDFLMDVAKLPKKDD